MVCLCFAGGCLSIEDHKTIDARLNEAAHLYERGDFSNAVKSYQDILIASPQQPDALLMMGIIAQRANKPRLALDLFEEALVARPLFPLAQFNRAVLLRLMGRETEAMMSVQMAVDADPHLAAGWDLMGQIYKDKGNTDQAAACYQRAIALQPNNANFYGNYGLLFFTQGETDAAFKAAQKAEYLDPNFPPILMGNLLLGLGYTAQAAENFARARELRTGFTEDSTNEAMALLQIGEWEKGWALWETRIDLIPDDQPELKNIPLWHGQKTDHLIVYEDQGLGDAIQFLRYTASVKDHVRHVTLRLRAPLHRLAAENFSCVTISNEGSPLPAADYRCRLSSLPFFFGTQLNAVPPTPYIAAPVERRAWWQEKIRDMPRPRIGLVWAGNANFRNDARRSLSVENLAPLLYQKAAHFISLQKDRRDSMPNIFDPTAEMSDFADTAALIAELDLVVSVDTATAHLAGSMGKPVWIMLPFISDWRWLLGREDSPWYKSARLFRQTKPDDWDSVIQNIASEIDKFIAGNKNILAPTLWQGECLRQHPQALPLPL